MSVCHFHNPSIFHCAYSFTNIWEEHLAGYIIFISWNIIASFQVAVDRQVPEDWMATSPSVKMVISALDYSILLSEDLSHRMLCMHVVRLCSCICCVRVVCMPA